MLKHGPGTDYYGACSQIIVPTPVKQHCDQHFPMMYHLDGGVFLQSVGDGMITSPPPQQFRPDATAPLAAALPSAFHELMVRSHFRYSRLAESVALQYRYLTCLLCYRE